MFQVAAASEPIPIQIEETVVKSASFVSQESLLSSSDEGSGSLERFLPEKLDSLNGDGFE